MDYYVSYKSIENGNGSEARPFRTISEAAEVALPGDTVWIGDGVYREWVSPAHGGTDENHRITYRAIEGEKPVISGAEQISDWKKVGEHLYYSNVPKSFFGDYCPFDDIICGDWYDSLGQDHHTGEVYADGHALYEASSLETIGEKGHESWYSVTDDEKVELWVWMPSGSPLERNMEVSVRKTGFFPKDEHIDYIVVSGLTVECTATQWAPPTAFQIGAIGTHWSWGWIIENCTVRNSKCSGISIGKRREETDNMWSRNPVKGGAQTYTETVFTNQFRDWKRGSVGGHIVRNNHIYDCGQAGIVGCMGGAFSRFENNHIHNITDRGEFSGAEVAGIKLHAGIDVVIKNNVIHDAHRGIWLDWEAQNARVTGNILYRHASQDIFVEVCHGPVTIDHNICLSGCSFLNMSQGTALAHNLFCGKIVLRPETGRFTMYHIPHETAVLGSIVVYGGDDRCFNNVFIGKESGTACYNGYPGVEFVPDTSHRDAQIGHGFKLAVRISGNAYLNDAKAWEGENDACNTEEKAVCVLKTSGGKDSLHIRLPRSLFETKNAPVDSERLGYSFESGGRFENPDGSPFSLDTDFFGNPRNGIFSASPFTDATIDIPDLRCPR